MNRQMASSADDAQRMEISSGTDIDLNSPNQDTNSSITNKNGNSFGNDFFIDNDELADIRPKSITGSGEVPKAKRSTVPEKSRGKVQKNRSSKSSWAQYSEKGKNPEQIEILRKKMPKAQKLSESARTRWRTGQIDGSSKPYSKAYRKKREAERAAIASSVMTSTLLPDVDDKPLGLASLESMEL